MIFYLNLKCFLYKLNIHFVTNLLQTVFSFTASHQAVGNLETSMFGRNFQTKLFPEGMYGGLVLNPWEGGYALIWAI